MVDDKDKPFENETHVIIGAAFEVLNVLGHGLLEKTCENALCVEFKLRDIPFVQQTSFPVLYKVQTVGKSVPDLIAYGNVSLTRRRSSASPITNAAA